MATPEQAKLDTFLRWLRTNGAELRGTVIKPSSPENSYGVFAAAADPPADGILMVIPLDLAITPMRVLMDPFVGPRCRALFGEGNVDDRFLIMLFLTVERLRPGSLWKPYLDMLPTVFGNPLWFTDEELEELKGTTLYKATVVQKKSLRAVYENKVKGLVDELIRQDGESTNEVQFEDFLWANSVFWTRALNIPLPHSYVFPKSGERQEKNFVGDGDGTAVLMTETSGEASGEGKGDKVEDVDAVFEKEIDSGTSSAVVSDTVWVEGLVPGIDFCNHSLKGSATWEVDGVGSVTGIPASMYLMLADWNSIGVGKEIFINYGNKGNEELLYLYGFVLDNNPDDYLMVHYPMEALQKVPFANRKAKLLEAQKAELRCLLPKNLLNHGFVASVQGEHRKDNLSGQFCNYSWSGQRKVPSYVNKLVFPQEFLTALRTIAMQEHDLLRVSVLLKELARSGKKRQPSDREVQAAVWEGCGDYGALQLLVDILSAKVTELEEGSGKEDCDAKLLEKFHGMEFQDFRCESRSEGVLMSRNRWLSIVYRRGQKQLARSFLKEAELALETCISEKS